MANKIRTIGVLTSGGDAPGMNAAIRAVVRSCAYHNIKCIGVYRGFQGLIEGDFIDLGPRSVKNIINKGGTFLKSARSTDFRTEEGRAEAMKHIRKSEMDALIVIGGDGSFMGSAILSREYDFPVIGIPGTIDNDIEGTDFTIGYDTALNTVVEAIDKIRDTASSHNRLFLVEVMGRDAGDIALNAGVGAGAEEILIPEEQLGRERLVEKLAVSKKSGKTSSIVVIAEGDKIGKNIFELADYITETLPEYDVRVTVLGHIQRGGSPSCSDRVLASRLGVGAVDALIEGKARSMVAVRHKRIITVPFTEVEKRDRIADFELIRVSEILSI